MLRRLMLRRLMLRRLMLRRLALLRGMLRREADEASPAEPWPGLGVDGVAVADWIDVEGMAASGTELTESTVGEPAESVTVVLACGSVQRNVVLPPGVDTETVSRPCAAAGTVAVIVVGLVTEKLTAGVAPKATDAASNSFDPWISTIGPVPSVPKPVAMVTLLTTGFVVASLVYQVPLSPGAVQVPE
jgi:hypothetical protein